MTKINIDLTFAFIEAETYAARRHAEIALRRLDSIEEDIRHFVLAELESSGYADDEAEVGMAFQEIYFLEDVLPRLETYALLFVLFSIFETVIKRLPTYVGDWTEADVTSGRGRSFVSKAVRFYDHELGVPLFSNQVDEHFVRLLADLRNAIGHSTGKIAMLKRDVRMRLEQAASRKEGIRISDGELRIGPNFIRETAMNLDRISKEVIDRLKAAK